MMRNRLAAIVLLASVAWISGSANAVADCSAADKGSVMVGNINVTSTSITVMWAVVCRILPARVELRQGGTNGSNFQDGTLLGSTNITSFLMNAGGTTASNLKPSTPYANLRLCAIYPSPNFESWCSAPFASLTAARAPQIASPSNLTVVEQTAWVTPTRWQRKLVWRWTPGAGYQLHQREIRVSNFPDWFGEGSRLLPTVNSYEEVINVFATAAPLGRVCGVNPQDAPGAHSGGCSNASQPLISGPPPPKAPVALSAVQYSDHDIHITFWGGDENITAWYKVQRADLGITNISHGGVTGGRIWVDVGPQINQGSSGFIVDRVDTFGSVPVKPLTYRVCAGNALATTCSNPFLARPNRNVPRPPFPN